MLRLSCRSIALLIGFAISLATPVVAQDVEYTSTSKVDFSGFLGAIASLSGAEDETIEKTYLKGGKLRTDADKSSSIVDLEAGRFITVDHDRKTYTVMTFEQMVQMMEQAAEQAREQAGSQSGAAPTQDTDPQPEPEGDVDLTYSLDVEPTGERQNINGYEAERIFMTMETEIMVTPEGGETEQAGTLVIFMDMWNADNVPAAEAMKAYYEKAPEMASRNAGAMQGMAAAFAGNPGLQDALDEASKETEKLSGFTVRETTHMVMVPQGMEFDRELALVVKPKASAGETAKKALGGLFGLGAKKEEPREEAPAQFTLVKMMSEVKDMKVLSLPDDLFAPPAGYTEKPVEMPSM
jgi:hypothetical protein